MGDIEAAAEARTGSAIDGLPVAIFKSTPEDFVVEEIAAYAPSGKGEHLFVRFRKRDLTTHEAVKRLAHALESDPRGAGVAGQKDKVAVTTQWASFPLPIARGEIDPASIASEGIEVLDVQRHDHKLKAGHLTGNRFRVVLRGLDAPAAAALEARLAAAGATGVPNAYGPQRYGRDGDNPERALAWLRGAERGPRDKREQRFLFSSLQSHLFDRVLAQRVASDTHLTVLPGDLAKKADTGGMFVVPSEPEALADARARAARLELSATGPMFGASMRWPEGVPGEIERSVLAAGFGDEARLKALAHLGEGTRRVLRLVPTELATFAVEGGLGVGFVLPKGGYATTFLGAVCRLVAERGIAGGAPSEGPGPSAERPARRRNRNRTRWFETSTQHRPRGTEMNLVEWLQRVMVKAGSEWVLWIMIVLSVVSVAIILERAWFFSSLRDDLVRLARDLQAALDDSIEAAQKRMAASPSAEAAVVSAGLAMAHRGPDAAEEAMAGAAALQRMKLEKRLAFLGTLGNNAPFIGLFGTVIGIVMAFDALSKQAQEQVQNQAQNMAPTAVMGSIAEALVATAVGIGIAIPAVAANNTFQRMTRSTLANTEALTRILLAHLKSEGGPVRLAPAAAAPRPAPPADEPRPANKKKAAPKKEKDEDDGAEEKD